MLYSLDNNSNWWMGRCLVSWMITQSLQFVVEKQEENFELYRSVQIVQICTICKLYFSVTALQNQLFIMFYIYCITNWLNPTSTGFVWKMLYVQVFFSVQMVQLCHPTHPPLSGAWLFKKEYFLLQFFSYLAVTEALVKTETAHLTF